MITNDFTGIFKLIFEIIRISFDQLFVNPAKIFFPEGNTPWIFR